MGEIVTVQQTEISDFEVLQHAMQDGPSEVIPLQPGRFTGNLMQIEIGKVGVSTASFSRAVRGRGIPSDHRWMFCSFTKPAVFQDFEMAPGDLFLLAPGHEHYVSHRGANSFTALFVEPDELFGFASTHPGAQDAAMWKQSATVLIRDQGTDAAHRRLSTLIASIRDHGATMSAEVADYHKRCLLEVALAPVINGSKYRGPRLRSAVALVREVDRFLVDAGARPVHISELCAKFGVPRHRLYRAFQEVHGMSPMQFHQYIRLGQAHSVLLMAVPGVTTEEVAIKHGFPHLGRFAGNYRAQFGELPSETLRRPAKTKGGDECQTQRSQRIILRTT